MLKPSSNYPVSSADKTRVGMCKMNKMIVKVRLSTCNAADNTWTDDFAAFWNYLGDQKATIEDLRQTVAGQMVLAKVSNDYACFLTKMFFLSNC